MGASVGPAPIVQKRCQWDWVRLRACQNQNRQPVTKIIPARQHAGMKSIPILTQLSKCWDFLWDFHFNDVIPRSRDLTFFSKSDILCQTCPIPQQIYIYIWIIYTKDKSFLDYARWKQKSWFFLTQIDHVMHKLPADYVINLRYMNQNRPMDLQRPSFMPSFMDN